jgi:hypothetical protein
MQSIYAIQIRFFGAIYLRPQFELLFATIKPFQETCSVRDFPQTFRILRSKAFMTNRLSSKSCFEYNNFLSKQNLKGAGHNLTVKGGGFLS